MQYQIAQELGSHLVGRKMTISRPSKYKLSYKHDITIDNDWYINYYIKHLHNLYKTSDQHPLIVKSRPYIPYGFLKSNIKRLIDHDPTNISFYQTLTQAAEELYNLWGEPIVGDPNFYVFFGFREHSAGFQWHCDEVHVLATNLLGQTIWQTDDFYTETVNPGEIISMPADMRHTVDCTTGYRISISLPLDSMKTRELSPDEKRCSWDDVIKNLFPS